jgi:hypothetical protein
LTVQEATFGLGGATVPFPRPTKVLEQLRGVGMRYPATIISNDYG